MDFDTILERLDQLSTQPLDAITRFDIAEARKLIAKTVTIFSLVFQIKNGLHFYISSFYW